LAEEVEERNLRRASYLRATKDDHIHIPSAEHSSSKEKTTVINANYQINQLNPLSN